jgi:di/tricarboxylate transporter
VAVYGLTLITTELLSNAAAVALVLLITTAVFAASQSFSSPIVYQTNLMVFAPGRYRFLDAMRYGWPLSLLYGVTMPALVLWLG